MIFVKTCCIFAKMVYTINRGTSPEYARVSYQHASHVEVAPGVSLFLLHIFINAK